MAAFLVAAKAIKESGFPLKGDLIVSAVAGEISREPIEEWQGRCLPEQGPRRPLHGHPRGRRRLRARGRGDRLRDRRDRAGQGALQGHGPHGHAALLHAVPAAPHRPRGRAERDRPRRGRHRRVREVGVRLPAAEHVPGAERDDRPEGEHQRDPVGLPVQPDERARSCARSMSTRGSCPGANPMDVRDELRGVLRDGRRRGHRRAVPVPAGLRGEGRRAPDRDDPALPRPDLRRPPAIVGDPVTSMWRDTNAFNELGIPAISYAPRATSHATGRPSR